MEGDRRGALLLQTAKDSGRVAEAGRALVPALPQMTACARPQPIVWPNRSVKGDAPPATLRARGRAPVTLIRWAPLSCASAHNHRDEDRPSSPMCSSAT